MEGLNLGRLGPLVMPFFGEVRPAGGFATLVSGA